jgi:hypothetical protein
VRRSRTSVRITYNHAGLTHFGGTYLLRKAVRVLQLRPLLTRHLRSSPSALAGESAAYSSSDAEAGFIALTDCYINLWGKCSFVGQIRMKIASFTPDLGVRTYERRVYVAKTDTGTLEI